PVPASVVSGAGARRHAARRRCGQCARRAARRDHHPGHLQGAEPVAVPDQSTPALHRVGAAGRAVARPGPARTRRAPGGTGVTAALVPSRVGGRGRRIVRAPEFTLVCLAVTGFVALTIGTHGNLLAAGTLSAFFRFLAIPMVIGLSQMVVLAI